MSNFRHCFSWYESITQLSADQQCGQRCMTRRGSLFIYVRFHLVRQYFSWGSTFISRFAALSDTPGLMAVLQVIEDEIRRSGDLERPTVV